MEFNEVVVKENLGLCRCCLSEGCYKDVCTEYTWMNETEIYAEMLMDCFDISIMQHSDGPNGASRLICEVCITRLRDACNFKKQVQETEKKFIDMISKGEFQPKALQEMKSEVEVEVEPETENTVNAEYLEDEMDFSEAVKEDSDSDYEQPGVSRAATPPKKKRLKKIKIEPPKKGAITAGAGTFERRRANLTVLFNNTSIIPFKWRGRYRCFYCGQTCPEYTQLRKHTKSHGSCTTRDYSLKALKNNQIEVKIDVSEIACDVCEERFATVDDVVSHLIGKHRLNYDEQVDMPLQGYRLVDCRCLFCDEQFSYFGNLVQHVNVNHPQNEFVCNYCGGAYNKKRDLAHHIRTVHREGGYPCDQCAKVFETRQLLLSHKNKFHFKKCIVCVQSFSTNALLKKHVALEHSKSDFKCDFCSKQFRSLQGCNHHLRICKVRVITQKLLPINTPDEEPLVPKKKKQNVARIRKNIHCVLNMSTAVPFKFLAKFGCFYCHSKFVEFDDLKAHTHSEHPVCDLKAECMRRCKGDRVTVKIDIVALTCRLCSQTQEDLDSLIDHLISKHNADYDKSIDSCFQPHRIIKDNIQCPSCSKVFRYFNILLRHINADHSNNSSICDFCGRSFGNMTNLNIHIAHIHNGRCECEICGAKFKNQQCLARHKATNHDVRDYPCPKCPEKFQSQYQKQKHMIKVHDIGHKCSYCNRMFTRNSFMKDHIRRTHLKEKNVSCTLCTEKFFDNYLLKLHMAMHQGDRKFTCGICSKSFLRRSNLYSHNEMHKKYGHDKL